MAGAEIVATDRDEPEESSYDHEPLGGTGERIYRYKMLMRFQSALLAEMVRLQIEMGPGGVRRRGDVVCSI